jgi:copper chaperone CopZ
MLAYTHFVPGRLRVKIPELRNPRRAAETEAEIAALPAVTKVVANPITGSVTINYDRRQLPISELWESLSARGYVSGRCPEAAGARDRAAPAESTQRLSLTIMTALFDALVQHSAQALVRELL